MPGMMLPERRYTHARPMDDLHGSHVCRPAIWCFVNFGVNIRIFRCYNYELVLKMPLTHQFPRLQDN